MNGLVVTQPEPICYSRRDAAASLGICERVLFDLVQAGKIREIRIGRSVRIPRSELIRYVRDLLDEAESPESQCEHGS